MKINRTLNLLFSILIDALLTNYLALCQNIKLSDVESLTFYKDKFTTSRHMNSVPQLKCDNLKLLSFSNCYKFHPNIVECFNRGTDGINIQWECEGNLNRHIRFGNIKVTCENYNSPNDPYILEGSCALEFSLETISPKNFNDYYDKNLYETNKLSNFLTLLIMIVIMLAIYKSCSKNRDMDPRLDFNTTYAQVIHGTDSTPITGVYPPPPPPYVFNCSLLNPNAINTVSLPPQRNYNSTVKPDFILNQEILNNNSVISVVNNEENSSSNSPTVRNDITPLRRNDSPPPAYEEVRVNQNKQF